MASHLSKKAETLKAETKKLEDIAKKKAHAIEKTERTEEQKAQKEIHQIGVELNNFKKMTEDVISGKAEPIGWDEQAVSVGQRMKYLIEEESRVKHNLFIKADEAAKELELKAKPIRKDVRMISDFSEDDRVQLLLGIEKSIKILQETCRNMETAESKLNRKMQVLIDNTPDPAEDKESILRKLQMSYEVLSGANDPDRVRDDVLSQINKDGTCPPSSKKTAGSPPRAQNKTPQPANAPKPKH